VPNRVHTPEPRARKVLGLSSVKKVLSAVDPRSAFSLFSTRSMRRWFFVRVLIGSEINARVCRM
jgi:hypothetical protein